MLNISKNIKIENPQKVAKKCSSKLFLKTRQILCLTMFKRFYT